MSSRAVKTILVSLSNSPTGAIFFSRLLAYFHFDVNEEPI